MLFPKTSLNQTLFNPLFHFGKSETSLNQKNFLKLNMLKSKNYCIRCNNVPLFFWFDHFLDARAEIRDFFCNYLKTLQFISKSSWPLVYIVQDLNSMTGGQSQDQTPTYQFFCSFSVKFFSIFKQAGPIFFETSTALFFYRSKIDLFWFLTKGQLISKCLLGVIVWTKFTTNFFPGFLP